MGCASSKQVKSTVDVYRPPPSSFAVFNINTIDEPWVVVEHSQNRLQEKPAHLPPPILDKLNTFESDVPHSWDEISKALEDLKPAINDISKKSPPKPPAQVISKLQNTRKSASFHTLEELDAKLSSKPVETEERKTESMRNELRKTEETKPMSPEAAPAPAAATRVLAESVGFKSLKDNIFLVRDRQEREKEGNTVKRDPLSEFPEKCPPGGADSVVVYTTSLRGVRRTHEDCSRLRGIFEVQGVVVDERDVSLHGEYLNELRGLLGEEATVPRVFLKGRYLGGVEELVKLNETGRLGRLLRAARVERGVERVVCEGCGGARFVPCMDCGGSCKVVVGRDKRERCGKCNENGLVHCPACF